MIFSCSNSFEVVKGLFPRSGVAADFVSSAVCLESDDGADRVVIDAATPAAGQVLFYLVRVENGCPGYFSLGVGAGGEARSGLDCP